jgi:NCS1 family nucleobase:cation symporter-1
LFIGDKRSIYWFNGGFNWRAFLAWTLAVWPSFPGFIAATGAITVNISWRRCFQVTWIIGFCGGAAVYYLITLISPPPGRPFETVYWHNESEQSLEGTAVEDNEKVAHGRTKTLDQDSRESDF